MTPENTTPRRAKAVIRRARQLGRCDSLKGWIYERAREEPAELPPHMVCLNAKAAESRIPVEALLHAYRRGVIDYQKMIREEGPSPVSANEFAQARVNRFIRLAQGDPDVCTDDSDLLRLVPTLA